MLGMLKNQRLRELDSILRFNKEKTFMPKTNISQHSYWVVFFCHMIFQSLFRNAREMHYKSSSLTAEQERNWNLFYSTLIQSAIFHDFDETLTGDLEHGFKYNEHNGAELRKLINEYIDMCLEHNHFNDLDLNREVYNYHNSKKILKDKTSNNTMYNLVKGILKISDWLACIKDELEEIEAGNKNFDRILKLSLRKMKSVMGMFEFDLITAMTDGTNGINFGVSNVEYKFFKIMSEEIDLMDFETYNK